ncbi:MAG: phage regulatory CII family protein [Planctomycetota bacterium]
MESWEILREATEEVGVKAVAARLGVSTALVYKWCQESRRDDADASGAPNPLDRLKTLFEVTRDQRLVNWLCSVADGFFVPNPRVRFAERDEELLGTTQRVVQNFGNLLSQVSRSIENDGRITKDEAERIRRAWETLKSHAECFVAACERGLYADDGGKR